MFLILLASVDWFFLFFSFFHDKKINRQPTKPEGPASCHLPYQPMCVLIYSLVYGNAMHFSFVVAVSFLGRCGEEGGDGSC